MELKRWQKIMELIAFLVVLTQVMIVLVFLKAQHQIDALTQAIQQLTSRMR